MVKDSEDYYGSKIAFTVTFSHSFQIKDAFSFKISQTKIIQQIKIKIPSSKKKVLFKVKISKPFSLSFTIQKQK